MFEKNLPLAERMRPSSLDELLGQSHLFGEKGVLRQTISAGVVPSMILWGAPGVGKTTIANIIANQMKRPFHILNAISSGVKELRAVIAQAKGQSRAILFIDEIHRFNKSQQDALLGAVEKGIITLIGATTENPSFEVNSALLSRSQVYKLKSLTENDLLQLLENAMSKDLKLKKKDIQLLETGALLSLAGGDARKLLNLFELVVESETEDKIIITNENVSKIAQKRVISYDKGGELHYDIVSALIKSIRGSDPNAALYWLARMIEGGEDVKFIARRLVIAAAEDIGNANPTALVLATNCFQAVNLIGFPESRLILGQCVSYLASSAKSNASYMAINKAQKLVQDTGDLPVPLHLRNAPTKLMKKQGYGLDYKYPHNHASNFVKQDYMPEELKDTKLYDPANNPRENALRKYLKACWEDKYDY
jgi:putative ATPase